MSDSWPSDLSPESLLRHAEWVRRLVRSLVREDRVDDVVQQTWLKVLERPPRHSGSVKAWLGTVARNVARRTGRDESRRQHRESSAGGRGSEEPTAPDDIVERANLHKLVVATVLGLNEPYRSTLLAHYFDGRSVEAISDRGGLSVETVRTRLKRGRALLRTKLGSSGGAFAVVPWWKPSASSWGASGLGAKVAQSLFWILGAILMGVKSTVLSLAVVTVALVGLCSWLFMSVEPEGPNLPMGALRPVDSKHASRISLEEKEHQQTSQRTMVRPSSPGTSLAETDAVNEDTCTLIGTVTDAHGRGVVGATIALFDGNRDPIGDSFEAVLCSLPGALDASRSFHSRMMTVSDHDARFVFEDVPPLDRGILLGLAAPGGIAVVHGMELRPGEARVRLILKAATTIQGTVRDLQGAPIPQAEITLLGVGVDGVARNCARIRTDELGQYQTPPLPYSRLLGRVERAGFQRWRSEISLPIAAPRFEQDIVLHPVDVLEGRFVDSRGGAARLRERLSPYLLTSSDEEWRKRLKFVATSEEDGERPRTVPDEGQGQIDLERDRYRYSTTEAHPHGFALWWDETLLGWEAVGRETDVFVVRYDSLPDVAPVGAIEITVRDEAGDPVRDYNVRVVSEYSRNGGRFDATHKNVGASEGRFVVARVPAGAYRIEITPHGYALDYGSLDVKGEETALWSRTASKAIGAVDGTVRDRDGNSVTHAVIEILHRDGRRVTPIPGRSNAKGRFRIDGLAPGEYTVIAREDALIPTLAWKDVRVDPEGHVDLVLEEGFLVDFLIEPEVESVRLRIVNAAEIAVFDDSRLGLTRGGGPCSVSLPQGDYRVEVAVPGYALGHSEFTLRKPKEVGVRLRRR